MARIPAHRKDTVKRRPMTLDVAEQGFSFQALIEHSSDIINVMDRTGTILYTSPSTERILGYVPEELIGRNAFRLMHPLDMPAALREYWRGIRNPGMTQTSVFRFRHKDGTWRWLESVGAYRSNAEGKSLIVVNSRDVTARRQTDERLVSLQTRQELILDSTAEGIVGVDLNGNCIFANRACANLLGYATAEALLGLNMHRTVHHTTADGRPYAAERCALFRAVRHGVRDHSDRDVFWKADGTSFPVEYWSHPMMEGRKLSGAVISFLDTSQRRQLQDMLFQSEKLSAIGQLAAGAAHELHNPLMGILGYAEILLKGRGLSAEQRQDIETIETQGRRCRDIIQHLLQFSRHHQREDHVSLDLPTVLEEVVRLVKYEWTTSGFSLIQQWPKKLPAIIGSPDQLSQVFLNLMDNAKYAISTRLSRNSLR